MASKKDKKLIYALIKKYVNVMKEHNIPVWRLYLYGSDLRIEPHSFAKSDFDETNPYIKAIIETGERII